MFAFDDDGAGGVVGGMNIGNFQSDHLAGFVGRAVYGDDFVIVMNDRGGVDAGFGERNAPDRIAGAGIDANNAAIAGRRDQDAAAIEESEVRQ